MSVFKPDPPRVPYLVLELVLFLCIFILFLVVGFSLITFPVGIAVATIFVALIAIPLLISHTIRYKLERENLVILILGWKKIIPFDSIAQVRICPPQRVLRLRKFGIGIYDCLKLGRYTGDYGDVRAYVTSGRNTLLIELKNGKRFAINPKNLRRFIGKLECQKVSIDR